MAQDLLVESHLGSSPRYAARCLGSALGRRFAPHRPTIIWEVAVRGEGPSEELVGGLADALSVESLGGHMRVDWTSIEVGESRWRVPTAALGANLALVLGGEGSLAARLPALHDLARPRAPLSDLGRLAATAAVVFENGPHAFAVPNLETGSRLGLVDRYVTALVGAGDRTVPAGLRVAGIAKLPLGVVPETSGLPFIEPLYRS